MKTSAIISLLLALACTAGAQQLAFPGAEGFGMYALGGRGGTVYEVTNLDDDGPGSLRVAVKASGPRIVVFRVSGTINLLDELKISKPYITIAGQTAPGDGICIKGDRFRVAADHVIIRYIRFRLGDEAVPEDAVWVDKGYNIIFDHCSASWAVDETLSVAVSESAAGSSILGNVTVQWCIISESLDCSIHPKGCHGYGSLIRGGWGNGYTYHHNLYADHRGRNPRPGNYINAAADPAGLVFDFRNNVVYNWGDSYAGYNADVGTVTRMNFVGNYYKQGPDSEGDDAFREQCKSSTAYFSGNCMNGSYPSDPWDLVRFDDFNAVEIAAYKQSTPIPVAPVETDDALTALGLVIIDAGASFPHRDDVDTRVINGLVMATGTIIDSQNEVGGWPVLQSSDPPVDSDHDGMPDEWESTVCCLDPCDPADAAEDRNGDGYTNIEEYINWLPLGEPMPACDNSTPVADAGPDRVAYAWIDGFADVTLDGSASYDADGDTLNCHWSWSIAGNEYSANGVAPAVRLPVGEHQVRLDLDDGCDSSQPDYCTITVIEPLQAEVRCLPSKLNPDTPRGIIIVRLTLPAGVSRDDIEPDQPVLLVPGMVESRRQVIFPVLKDGRWCSQIVAVFETGACTPNLSDGPNEVKFVGRLKSGQYFDGETTLDLTSS